MAHIKDLQLNILQRVLAYFYDGVRYDSIWEFKQLLPPAAVCRVWREWMLPYVYRTAYLEYYIKETEDDNEAVQPEYEWKSNIDLIVSQQLSSEIKRLRIESYRFPLNFADMIHALDAFGFSSSHWRAANVLHIDVTPGAAVNDDSPSSSGDEVLAAQLTEYFGQHLPNIGDLHILIPPQSTISRILSNKLVNFYISQLHSLFWYPDPITFNCHSFSSRLRYLSVGIASGVTSRLPQLLASPLEYLSLFDIPHNFVWWTFVGSTPGHIEFTNLTSLNLTFRQPSENASESNGSNRQVGMSTVSLNIGRRKLFFPKLRKLHIVHSPYDDGALYSMFVHSPLQTVRIRSSFKSIQHMDPRTLFNAENIRFRIQSISPEDYHDYVEFCRKLLRTPSNARSVRLDMYQSSVPLPIPSMVEWINLKRLDIGANIHLASVIQVITQLPKLHTLGVMNIVDEVNEAGTSLQAILRRASTQTQSIATNIKSLWIYLYLKLPLVFSLDVMCYLTVLIHSLDELVVPDLYVSDIKEFAAHHANAFPHLHSIKVHGKI